MSHGGPKDHLRIYRDIRKATEHLPWPVAIMADTRGVEIRTGDVVNPIAITKGQQVLFRPSSQHSVQSNDTIIEVGYDNFAEDVREAETILLDNGALSFDVVDIRKDGCVVAKAKQDGSIGSRRHINLPGADINLPSVTELDMEDIARAAEAGVDIVALSFIRRASDIVPVRALLQGRNSRMHLCAKIETRQAVDNLEEILAVVDSVMVARGDLGAEVPFEHLPVIQDRIVRLCRQHGKPVIVATHMLLSMTEHPLPTRAEVTDVAHAAYQRTDCTMLSDETAGGKHPALCLGAMTRILNATEDELRRQALPLDLALRDEADNRASAAVEASQSPEVRAIVVTGRTGATALRISRCRPLVPIVACSEDAIVARHLQMAYGVVPLTMSFEGSFADVTERSIACATEAGVLSAGDRIVIVSDIETAGEPAPSIQLRTA